MCARPARPQPTPSNRQCLNTRPTENGGCQRWLCRTIQSARICATCCAVSGFVVTGFTVTGLIGGAALTVTAVKHNSTQAAFILLNIQHPSCSAGSKETSQPMEPKTDPKTTSWSHTLHRREVYRVCRICIGIICHPFRFWAGKFWAEHCKKRSPSKRRFFGCFGYPLGILWASQQNGQQFSYHGPRGLPILPRAPIFMAQRGCAIIAP